LKSRLAQEKPKTLLGKILKPKGLEVHGSSGKAPAEQAKALS
jgi:hypothetical protein